MKQLHGLRAAHGLGAGGADLVAATACGFASCETHNNWLATVRGRIGMPIDRFLPYVTGGLAFGDITAGNSNAGFGTASTEKVGWTAGAGFEYALTGLVSAKVEYLHVNLGTFDCARACSVAGSDNVSWSANILRGESISSSTRGASLRNTDRDIAVIGGEAPGAG